MNDYRVRWEINIETTSAEAAAEQALDIQRDGDSMATIFQVSLFGNNWTIDLEDRFNWKPGDRRPARRSPWQPIETAPLDGTPVIVAKIAVSHSHDGTKLVPAAKPHVWWAVTARHMPQPDGRVCWRDGNFEALVPPTHWMPIPAIPDEV